LGRIVVPGGSNENGHLSNCVKFRQPCVFSRLYLAPRKMA
jgi:hypothetical protein